MSTEVANTGSNVQNVGFEFVTSRHRPHVHAQKPEREQVDKQARPNYFAYEVISTPRSSNKFVRHYREQPPQLQATQKPSSHQSAKVSVPKPPVPPTPAVAPVATVKAPVPKYVTEQLQEQPQITYPKTKTKRLKIPKLADLKKGKLQRTQIANLTIGLALCMCVWLGLNIYHLHHVTAAIEQKPTNGVLGASDTNPEDDSAEVTPGTVSEKKPTGNYHYDLAAPKKLVIKKLGVNAPIIVVGDTKKGDMATPNNIWTAGWYKKSASPKDNGTTVINGHVHGPTKPGIFSGLKKLSAGDQIQVVTGDNTSYTYKVVRTQVYSAGSMGAELYNSVSNKPGLNLVTCTGELNKDHSSYNERLVVYTERM